MSQISVASGHRLFHLVVRAYDDPERNLAKAKELGRALAGKIH